MRGQVLGSTRGASRAAGRMGTALWGRPDVGVGVGVGVDVGGVGGGADEGAGAGVGAGVGVGDRVFGPGTLEHNTPVSSSLSWS